MLKKTAWTTSNATKNKKGYFDPDLFTTHERCVRRPSAFCQCLCCRRKPVKMTSLAFSSTQVGCWSKGARALRVFDGGSSEWEGYRFWKKKNGSEQESVKSELQCTATNKHVSIRQDKVLLERKDDKVI